MPVNSINKQIKKPDADLMNAVLTGLSAKQKSLPSRFFYDARGDELFRRIMKLPEYYPTRCEAGILLNHREDILSSFGEEGAFRLIEPGAGDGKKTMILLQHFMSQGADFSYYPADISEHVLDLLTRSLKAELPELRVHPIAGEYSEVIGKLSREVPVRKAVLFLGSNIGNFVKKDAVRFLCSLTSHLNPGDKLLIGFDLKKDPDIIYRAYNDNQGVTREFNLNLLRRINRELGADFKIETFRHYPIYAPAEGEMKSYLISEIKQDVQIPALGRTFSFDSWEAILTEISAKYSVSDIRELAENAGLKVERLFFDSKKYYSNALLVKK